MVGRTSDTTTQDLSRPLTDLEGIGPKRAASMAQKGLHSLADLLYFMPLRYEDRSRISPIGIIEEGQSALVKGSVVSSREERFYGRNRRLFKISIRDEADTMELLWFQYRKPHLSQFASPGTNVLAYGKVGKNKGIIQMIHPDISLLSPGGAKSDEERLGFYPVYSLIKGISLNILRSSIRAALDLCLPSVIDHIPGKITRNLELPELPTALRNIHLPPDHIPINKLNRFETPFHKRLIFDRFFLVMLIIAFRKKSREKMSGPIFPIAGSLLERLGEIFPFKLTAHQLSAIEDMIKDFMAGKAMNRLVMGDVGCGKTVIAAVGAHITISNGRQAALMVPTQVLAEQHMDFFSDLTEKMGFRPVLLTGSLSTKERRDVYEEIRHGRYNMIIGTQSLIQESLIFSNLGMVIIDEQHRFGVRERALLERKGENPHLLVLTATPIPRTLALTLYGDMNQSLIKEYPLNRRPVVTRMVPRAQKRKVFETLKKRMSMGQQVFVICPGIDRTEDDDLRNASEMAERLAKIYNPDFRIGLIHGRLPFAAKKKAIDDFRNGRIDLLVGTTVIEVGVHVPRTTVMVVEHPERFGLAQLHQLRGRVGRGSEQGLCLLMVSDDIAEEALDRLLILEQNHDGFEIARMDMELRGSGEIAGMRQTGFGELNYAEIFDESKLLMKAREEAENLIASDPALLRPENAALKEMVTSVLSEPLDL
ncbi:ATP-dependent DNA helicase RecG [Thermodesulfobacteriota bacterium]